MSYSMIWVDIIGGPATPWGVAFVSLIFIKFTRNLSLNKNTFLGSFDMQASRALRKARVKILSKTSMKNFMQKVARAHVRRRKLLKKGEAEGVNEEMRISSAKPQFNATLKTFTISLK